MFTGGNSGEGPPRGRIILIAEIIALAATGYILWRVAVFSRIYRFVALDALLLEALGYALLAWFWSAVVTVAVYAIVPSSERGDLTDNVLRTSTTAVWFAPATILLSHFSPAALIPGLILVVNASRLLYCQWRISNSPPPPEPAPGDACRIFTRSLLPTPLLWRELTPYFAAALAVQAAACAALMRYPLVAAGFCAMSAAMLTIFAVSRGSWEPGPPRTMPRSLQGLAATVILAALMTVGGMAPMIWRGSGAGPPGGDGTPRIPYGRRYAGPGALDSLRILLRELTPERKASPESRAGAARLARSTPEPIPDPGMPMPPGGYPGVILWPEVQPTVTIVAPLPAGRGGLRPANPFGIPFGGEYWLYRWPFPRPPAGSYFARGTPVKLAFSTTDRARLQMEARQKLEEPIEIKCCGQIQLEILNADPNPQTVSLELLLMDSQTPRLSQTLGVEPVRSVPDTRADPPQPVFETLTYRIPETPMIKQFDEFQVVYYRNRPDKSARVAIRRFVLIPRAL